MNDNLELEELFNKACNYVVSSAFDISITDRLYFYARYKQALEGPCNTSKPSLFDPQGRKKWEAWNSIRDITKNNAMKQYVEKLSDLDDGWEQIEVITPTKSLNESWVSVSTMRKVDEERDDIGEGRVKTVFDYVKENDMNNLSKIPLTELNVKDDNQMSPLHWACDRGHLKIVKYLLDSNMYSIDDQDADGLTALHFAVSCGHIDIAKLLITRGGRLDLKDNEGSTAFDCAEDIEMKAFLDTLKH